MMNPRPIRILYLIGQLGLGGSERQLFLLLKHVDKTRFALHVVVFNPSANYTLDDDLREEGVKVYAIPDRYKDVPSRIAWLYKLCRRVRPDVIHSWSIHDNIYAGLVGWMAGVPRRLGSVRSSLASRDFLDFHPVIRWMILHSVQGLLVNSPAIVEQLTATHVPLSRIFNLVNCVEVQAPDLVARPEGIPSGARVVGMVGNLRSEKNYPLFVRGMARILPEFPDVYGIIVGQPVLASDPNVPKQIHGEINRLGVSDRVRVLGFHPNVPSLLRNIDLFCLTSDYEGTPNAILEAMAAGLPVIATRVGGVPQLVQDGETGLLIEPGDESGLADSLGMLLRDPHKMHRMGTAGRQRVASEFGCKVIVPRFEEYYVNQLKPR